MHITGRVNGKHAFPLPLENVWQIANHSLRNLNEKFGLEFHSFVLMPNHFHLFARDSEAILSKAMCHFMKEFSCGVSQSAGICGRLWGERFFSSVVSSDLYFQNVYRYVYQNPLRAGLVQDVRDYPFSTLPLLFKRDTHDIPLIEDFFFRDDPTETIAWLNIRPGIDEEARVRKGLRRKIFSPPRSDQTKRKGFDPTLLLRRGPEKRQAPFSFCR
ncbi:MAG: transposase [Bdellovibrionota bacterium]